MPEKIITCELGCINFYVNLTTGDYFSGQGLFPIKVCEGSKCVRGYTQAEMDSILEQERLKDEELRQSGLVLMMNT